MKFNRVTASSTLAAAALMVALTGCSGDDKKDPDATPDPTTSASSSSPGVITPPDVPDVPKIKKQKGIVADTEMTDCSTDPGDVTAKGSITNSAKTAKDLVVAVAWVDPAGSDVLARGIATFKNVAPGDSQDWSVDAKLAEGNDVQCVLSAYSGKL